MARRRTPPAAAALCALLLAAAALALPPPAAAQAAPKPAAAAPGAPKRASDAFLGAELPLRVLLATPAELLTDSRGSNVTLLGRQAITVWRPGTGGMGMVEGGGPGGGSPAPQPLWPPR
jgi:hypothetical protein